jgi:DNA-binding response OmpR family regulator
MNILVVDDDELILKVARSVLQKAGYHVSLAKDGHAALELIEQELFDMVITDANMPNGVSGFQLASTIRKREKAKNVPIMFLTGRKDKIDVARALEAGADDYVVKPIDADILLAKVEALLMKKKEDYGFAMAKVKAVGTWELDFEICALSEQGLNIVSKSSVPANVKIRLDSDLFSQMGLRPPQVRIMSCKPLQETGHFFIETSFVGLSELELSLIRRWIMMNPHTTKTA